jgi:hypothetical protein
MADFVQDVMNQESKQKKLANLFSPPQAPLHQLPVQVKNKSLIHLLLTEKLLSGSVFT